MLRNALIALGALLVLLVASAMADASIRVNTTTQARAAIHRIGDGGGTIILEPGTYGNLVIRDRGRRARWLTIRAAEGAITRRVVVVRSRRVQLVGLNMRGLLLVARSGRVRLEGLRVEGGRVRVYRSTRVRLRHSDLSMCAAACLTMPSSTRITVAYNTFHDCAGCDFVHVSRVRGLRLAGNSFDRALPGPCATPTMETMEEKLEAAGPAIPCNHQDLVQIVGGNHLTIQGNRFGLYAYGAAQLYVSGQYGADNITIRGNLFEDGDPAYPDQHAITGLIVGNPPGFRGLPTRVRVEGNTFLSGAVARDPAVFRYWPGVANGLILTETYATLEPALRPVVVGNTFAFLSHPQLVCGLAQTTDLPC